MSVRNRRALDRQRADEIEQLPTVPTPQARPRAEGIINAIIPQNDVDGYVREIARLWLEARDKFMAIGEYLIRAKQTLPHGEYELMIRTRLPFNPSAARKLRSVAEAVHQGRIPRDRLPNSYATAYELTLLTAEEFRIAQARSLVRPDVYLREIQALRAELRAPIGLHRRAALTREKQKIEKELERLGIRLAEISAELSPLGGSLDDVLVDSMAEHEVEVGS